MIGMGRFLAIFFLLVSCVFSQCHLAAAVTNSSGRLVMSTGVIRNFGEVSLEMMDQLRAELWLQVAASRQKDEDAALLLLSPAEVISARGQYPDIPVLAGNKMAAIQRLTLGTAPEFVEVGGKYVLFYEGVARGAWGVVLRQRLKRADETLKQLARQTLARKTYLDEFEQSIGKDLASGLLSAGGDLIPGLEKSRMETYIDEAEKRFSKP